MEQRPKILIVDDEPFNVDYLEQELEDLNYNTISAANGQEALAQVAAESPDLVLLDIMMPLMDGFEVLARLKADKSTHDIPVVIISAMNDIQSVARGIEGGAEDYLPKPFDPVLLQARISACLEKKRLRDREVEYLRQVERLTNAAVAVENNAFEPEALQPVAGRSDALGNLARVFQRMAREVYTRERRLRRQLEQLRLDMEERQQAAASTIAAYIPMDRRHALIKAQTLSDRSHGAALLADISGFTPLTEALAKELGLQRGAEELVRQLNQVFGALIDEVHRYRGSVIGFSGDAITCWFDVDDGLRATACALATQAAMQPFATITTPAGTTISFAIKVAVVAGGVRRFLVGDPHIQRIEVLAGQLLDELAQGEHQADRGEVLVPASIATQLDARLAIAAWRTDEASGKQFAVVSGLRDATVLAASPWPDLALDSLTEAEARPWLLPPVYEKVRAGKSEFLSELRPAAALFLKFAGIDYDRDDEAAPKLDQFVRWAQAVLTRQGGSLLQLTVGDKGSYLYAAFGVPVAHEDDAARAIAAALELQSPPAELPFITRLQTGLAYGQMRAGAYGSATCRTYGALGDRTNLAARLMQIAAGGILCDDAIYQEAKMRFNFERLPPITVKGKAKSLTVYRLTGERKRVEPVIDALSPDQQMTLKVASVIGRVFTLNVLRDIYPVEADATRLSESLQALEALDLIARQPGEAGLETAYGFKDNLVRETIYNLMLFAQRRQLHRAVAEWHERAYAGDLSPYYPLLAHHWSQAEDAAKTVHYLERAGEHARQTGAYQEALRYFRESLTLDTLASVLSADYLAPGEPEP